MQAPEEQPRTWLFYAAREQRGARWLEEMSEGNFVFWRHGSDAYTRVMRPGDMALVFLAGEKVEEGEILAIGTLPAIRSPFILDNEQRVQRIPILITHNLRQAPIPWKAILEATGLPPVRTQGAVHWVSEEVVELVSRLTGITLPMPLEESLARINPRDLWSSVSRQLDYFTVLPDYLTARSRKAGDLQSLPRITSAEQFTSLTAKELRRAYEPRESQAAEEAVEAEIASELPPAEETMEPVAEDLDFDLADVQIKGFTPRSFIGPGLTKDYSSPAIYTAGSIADRVMSGQQDRLRVDIEARAFARLIASESSRPPLSVGIFGRWGSGKSFFMNRIGEELEVIADSAQDGFHDGIVQVEFNAWHYMETNVWASLVDVIFKALDARVRTTEQGAQESLFDRLSTAQNLRLDAIENLARTVVSTSDARRAVNRARQEFEMYGPDGDQIWLAVLKELGIDRETDQSKIDIGKAAALLGNEKFTADVNSLRDLTSTLRNNVEEGRTAWTALKGILTTPMTFIGLAILLLLIPVLADGLSRLFDSNAPNLLLTATSALAGWGAVVAAFVRRGVTLLNKVNSRLCDIREAALGDYQSRLDEAELKLEGARQSLQAAEDQVQDALLALTEESPGARLASFIRRRAESDEYTRHLGVIATIRADFEQLSELMHASATSSQSHLSRFREEMQDKIAALKAAYPQIFVSEDSSTDGADRQPGEQLIVPQGELSIIRQKLQALESNLSAEIEPEQRPFTRIVLKIDDLDRCPHDKVADVLQAVHLFLNFPLFVILVCVDERWMSTSLIKKFGNLVDGSGGATTSDYLEKIFQIPYWTRPMDEGSCSDFAGYLIADITEKSPARTPDDKFASETGTGGHENVVDIGSARRTELPEEQVTNTEDRTAKDPVNDSPDVTGNPDPVTEKPENSQEPAVNDTKPSSSNSEKPPAPYTPLTLSPDESKALQALAGFAGDTPRRTLRFVNVYLLIKSTMEPGNGAAFVDVTGTTFGHQALLMQLALATRADEASRYYFMTLDRYKTELAKPDLDEGQQPGKASLFFKSYLLLPLEKGSTDLSVASRYQLERIVRVFLEVCGFPGKDLPTLLTGLGENHREEDRRLFEDLLDTETLARRYTFTPQDHATD